MIKNERQYLVTKRQAGQFEQAVVTADKEVRISNGASSAMRKIEAEALRSQLDELKAELKEYEELKSGEMNTFKAASFEELPRAFIKARIAMGLSQKDLADRLGLKEQQIQRYESTEYAAASFARMKEVIDALGVEVQEEIRLPEEQMAKATLFSRLKEVGIDGRFVFDRLLPLTMAEQLQEGKGPEVENLVINAANRISRVFGWSPDALLGGSSMKLDMATVGGTRFKMSAKPAKKHVGAYTVYAHYIALIVLEAIGSIERKRIPDSADEMRDDLLSSFGSITFENALKYAWGLGVAVIPLKDAGGFHGACWRIGGRNVIVLKQRTSSESRWLFDLLHELWHLGQEPEENELSIIEASETSADRRDSLDEQKASQFASDVILWGRSEDLVQLCTSAAAGSVERLKSVVPVIAYDEQVSVDALANYLAFRLSLQDINWWGTAISLQTLNANPWGTTRDLLLSFVNLHTLNEFDKDLLIRAISN